MRGNDDDPGLGARLILGGIAGFVATMAMTSAMRRLHRRLPAKEPLPPPLPGAAPELSLVVHFAWGAACGALLAAASPRMGRFSGALAGGGLWLASAMGWIPAFGLPRPAAAQPLRRNLVTLGAHFAWGWSSAEGIRELGKARTTLFAAAPAPAAPQS